MNLRVRRLPKEWRLTLDMLASLSAMVASLTLDLS